VEPAAKIDPNESRCLPLRSACEISTTAGRSGGGVGSVSRSDVKSVSRDRGRVLEADRDSEICGGVSRMLDQTNLSVVSLLGAECKRLVEVDVRVGRKSRKISVGGDADVIESSVFEPSLVVVELRLSFESSSSHTICVLAVRPERRDFRCK